MNNAIEVNNLSKRFMLTTEPQTLFRLFRRAATGKSYHKEIWALRDINFELKRGGRMGLIGNNGSGKTTLLRIITDIYKQSSGTIKINGKLSAFLHLEIGMLRDLSVLENIYLFGAIMGLDKDEVNKRLGPIMDFSGLQDYLYTPLRGLSMGMQQRLAFSIAKEVKSEILVLDEMLVLSDAGFREKCLEVLEKYKSENKAFMVVSPDMELIRRFCDKALLLDKGDQIALGPTEEVLDLYLKKYVK